MSHTPSDSYNTAMTSTEEYKREKRPSWKRSQRCRKRMSTLLHTHVALIVVCTLAALDAACVMGQVICDLLIVNETLNNWKELNSSLTPLLKEKLPFLNSTVEDLKDINDKLASRPKDILLSSQNLDPQLMATLLNAAKAQVAGGQTAKSVNMTGDFSPTPGNSSEEHMIIGIFKQPSANIRRRRAANKRLDEHDKMLNHLPHSFHIGSMVILSFLLLETLLKVFAMGKKVLHHKLEVFDAFIVSSSWILDVYFWQGIWDQPREEAATLLIYILPWRVVRIVNSFVLVIQEKDHVQLKIIKQRLRLFAKRSKETTLKAASYKTEVKQLQGLCRKYGATENEINACGLTGRNGRRRSSLVPAMEKAAALTLISALGSHPSLYTMDSSSDDDQTSRDLTLSNDLTLRSAYSSTTLDSADGIFIIDSKRNSEGYITSDNESTADVMDNPVFESEDGLTLRLEGQGLQSKDHVIVQCETFRGVPVETDKGRDTTSGLSSSQSSADGASQEVSPVCHEVVTKQNSVTPL